MPPKRSQRRKRPAQAGLAAEPPARRSRRTSTRHATLASESTQLTTAEPSNSPPDSTSGVTARSAPFSADQIQALVSTVAAEVTKQLTAQFPALTDVQGTETPTPVASRLPLETGPVPFLPQPTPAVESVAVPTMVNRAIAEAHAQIAGAPQLTNINTVEQRNGTPTQIFLSTSLPIDSRVSAKLKGKIWDEEFVDFGSLLGNPGSEKYQFAVQNSDAGLPASFCLEPVSRSRKITTIEAWHQAFLIFVGIYTQKYPLEAPALMKYGQIIRDLAARGQNWRFYDENFRYLRQTQASLVPWGSIHGELWLRSQYSTKSPSVIPAHNSKLGTASVPNGYCFKFHRGQSCSSNCAFKHNCFKCKGAHRASLCNFRAPTGKSSTTFDRQTKSSASNTS